MFNRYKIIEIRETSIGQDIHNSYDEVWEIVAWRNKKKKGKSRVIAKIIRDTYGRVFPVHLETKARKNKRAIQTIAYAKNKMKQEYVDSQKEKQKQ